MAKTKIATAEKRKSRQSKKVARLIALKIGEETGDFSNYEQVIKRPVEVIEKPKQVKKKKSKNTESIPVSKIHINNEYFINKALIENEIDYIRFNYKRKTISQIAKDLKKSNQYVLNVIRKNKTRTIKFFFYKRDDIEVVGSYYQLSKILIKHISAVMQERKCHPERFFEIKVPFESIDELKKSVYFNDLQKMYQNPCGSKDRTK